ncbi:MAG: SDR family oxidoreductase [bacterium]
MAEPTVAPAVRFDFTDRAVLVTGGTGGIGHAIAAAFAEAGAAVTVTGTRARASDYDADLGAFRYHPLDTRTPDSIEALVATLGDLDVLVNNAGANLPGFRSEWEPDVFEETLHINLVGAFRLSLAVRERLAASTLAGGASVVSIASLAAFSAVPLVPGYGAAKAGLVQLTKNLAAYWAPDRIRVNAVAPGFIATRMTEIMVGSEDLSRPVLERTPLGRWGEPEDVAPPVLFLASPAARFITGHTLVVDGGYSIVC